MFLKETLREDAIDIVANGNRTLVGMVIGWRGRFRTMKLCKRRGMNLETKKLRMQQRRWSWLEPLRCDFPFILNDNDKNILVWNCRGVGNKSFVSHAKTAISGCYPDFMVLLETRIASSRGSTILKELGFDNWELVEGNGFAGGIWMAWKSYCVNIEIIQKHFQFLHIRIKPVSGVSWLFTAVYANPNISLRAELWNELQSISKNCREEWLIVGDFNDIRDPFEKKRGAPIN